MVARARVSVSSHTGRGAGRVGVTGGLYLLDLFTLKSFRCKTSLITFINFLGITTVPLFSAIVPLTPWVSLCREGSDS